MLRQLSEDDGINGGELRSICINCQTHIAQSTASNISNESEQADLIFGSAIVTFVVHGHEDKVDDEADELDLTEVDIPAHPTNTCAHCRNKFTCVHDTSRFKKRERPILSAYRLRQKCEDCFHRSYGSGAVGGNRQIVNCKHSIPREWMEGYDVMSMQHADTDLSAAAKKILFRNKEQASNAAAVKRVLYGLLVNSVR